MAIIHFGGVHFEFGGALCYRIRCSALSKSAFGDKLQAMVPKWNEAYSFPPCTIAMTSSDFWVGVHHGFTIIAALRSKQNSEDELRIHVRAKEGTWSGVLSSVSGLQSAYNRKCAALREKSVAQRVFELISSEPSAHSQISVAEKPTRLLISAAWAPELKVVGVYLQVADIELESISLRAFYDELFSCTRTRNVTLGKLRKEVRKHVAEGEELEATMIATRNVMKKRQSKMAVAMAEELNEVKSRFRSEMAI